MADTLQSARDALRTKDNEAATAAALVAIAEALREFNDSVSRRIAEFLASQETAPDQTTCRGVLIGDQPCTICEKRLP